ncbi:MAG TPA: DUF2252 family protein [Kofleriaceae bacterium]|jgi:uncharacterized protein (DUF2252 family)
MRFVAMVCLATACTGGPDLDGRQQRIVNVLSEENYMWARRDPALLAMKLHKMQRGPYEWLRGTAGVFWRDTMEPRADRPTTTFGSPASSRVLLVGDPHPENVGTFRSDDGTMFLDWNDFDSSGYGPFTGDLRRLGAGLAVALVDPDTARMVVTRVVTSYAATMAALAAGSDVGPVAHGHGALFDDDLDKALKHGDAREGVNEVAPVIDGTRVLAVGDLAPIPSDGVIEDRVSEVSDDEAAWIDAAVAQWQAAHPSTGSIKLRARRIGSGVSSYAALRYNVILEGETDATDDDRLLELKETRDGLVIAGQPRFAVAEWSSPGARAVDTQQRLQALDGDPLLGSALVGALSLKIKDREEYQHGINHEDLAALVSNRQKDYEDLGAIADAYGQMLAHSHGTALTQDGVAGWRVIEPLLSGREDAFVQELTALCLDDAAQTVDDQLRMASFDLATLVVPESL